MRTIFVSFDEIGWACLEAILAGDGNVVGIFTLPDDLLWRRSGANPFDGIAGDHGIPLYKVRDINDPQTVAQVRELHPDCIFVIGWSQLIGKDLIDMPAEGCIGAHPTLLPKHRGRAPIPWAFIFGLTKTGVTMFYIDQGVDSGDVIDQVEIPILDEDTAATVYGKVLAAHVDLIERNYPLLAKGKAARIPQDHARASYWPKRVPADGIIDWNTRASRLYDWVRGLTHPYPGAFTLCETGRIIVWEAVAEEDSDGGGETAGRVLRVEGDGVLVRAGQGALLLRKIQLVGEDQEISGREAVARGMIKLGEVLG